MLEMDEGRGYQVRHLVCGTWTFQRPKTQGTAMAATATKSFDCCSLCCVQQYNWGKKSGRYCWFQLSLNTEVYTVSISLTSTSGSDRFVISLVVDSIITTYSVELNCEDQLDWCSKRVEINSKSQCGCFYMFWISFFPEIEQSDTIYRRAEEALLLSYRWCLIVQYRTMYNLVSAFHCTSREHSHTAKMRMSTPSLWYQWKCQISFTNDYSL